MECPLCGHHKTQGIMERPVKEVNDIIFLNAYKLSLILLTRCTIVQKFNLKKCLSQRWLKTRALPKGSVGMNANQCGGFTHNLLKCQSRKANSKWLMHRTNLGFTQLQNRKIC